MFSIIVSTHDRPLLLRRTLASLSAQTYTHFTALVVDDSAAYVPPFDELAKLDGRYVYIVRSGERGPAQSRNMALQLVESDYVLFLDDDDTFAPTHLEQLAALLAPTRPAVAFCDFRVQHEDRSTHPPLPLGQDTISLRDVSADSLLVRNRVPNSCVAYRRDVLQGLRFATDLRIYEDWDFLLQVLQRHPLLHLETDGVCIHKSQATAPQNERRGNTRDDLIVPTMLALYRKFPVPEPLRLIRQALLASAGVAVALEDC